MSGVHNGVVQNTFNMIIAIEGCAHGELEVIYETLAYLEKQQKVKVDLLLCCGDFQATRNLQDLQCMAVPDKYKSMCSFYKYFSGEKTAPVLTIFIGGNHEASNYLGELAYGGWVAPNIYYLGYAGVISVKGVRIAGISGIYKGHDYLKGHFEKPPYDKNQIRSAYHIRNLEIFRLKQIAKPLDIIMSHDWPLGITNFGDHHTLLKNKPFLRKDIENNHLGSPPAKELLKHLKPSYWFSAHLHCKFAALVEHSEESKKTTRFLALDKCLPRRKYLQILDISAKDDLPLELHYDLEWLTILHFTNHLMSVKSCANYMPGPSWPKRWDFRVTPEEMDFVNQRFACNLKVPLNFAKTVSPYDPTDPKRRAGQPNAQINPQTMAFCNKLGIDDPMALLLDASLDNSQSSSQILTCSLPADRSQSPVECSQTDDQTSDVQDASVSEDAKWFIDTSSSAVSSQEKPVWNSGSTAVKKRLSSLSLPPPSNETASESSLTSNKSLPDYHSPISQLNSSKKNSADESGFESPFPKRTFKRRNQALYSSCDDE